MKTYKDRPVNPDYFDMLGTSMLPTLHAGEGVTIDSEIDRRKLQVGDIIIYSNSNGNDKNIIHRIIKIYENGYMTRGDNNRAADDYIVKYDNILGKALTVRRSNRTIPLSGGLEGRLIHQLLKIKKKSLIIFLKIPSVISSAIDKSRIFNIFHRFIKIDIITVKKKKCTHKMILHNNKLIGNKCNHTEKWIIRFPYKYFIDRNKL